MGGDGVVLSEGTSPVPPPRLREEDVAVSLGLGEGNGAVSSVWGVEEPPWWEVNGERGLAR